MTKAPAAGDREKLKLVAERIRGRRTTKLFLRQKVSRQLVREAIEVARWAPNHHLTEPWHFYMLGPATIAACAKLIGDLVRETKGDEDLAVFKERSALSMPGWLLVTCRKSDDLLLEREDYAAVCCAIQNLALYLSEAGVACKWTTGKITRDQRLFDLIGIDSRLEFVAGLIWYGYPKTLPAQTRKGVDEITTETD
ncbi:MAG: nitroreductase family protein [Gammaproteobacteria bacterium]|nr:nitroreductase family protein [Gammaproteobacteria bacterium]